MSETTDVPDELVARAMTGEAAAVGRVLAIIRPLVVRYCRARLGRMDRSSVSADDVAQEVCLAVLTALPGYRVQGRPFLAFVYGIASHKVIDAHRAATRNRAEPVADVPDAIEVADGPEQRALRVELTGEMAQLLEHYFPAADLPQQYCLVDHRAQFKWRVTCGQYLLANHPGRYPSLEDSGGLENDLLVCGVDRVGVCLGL